jgi:hypothetical protein
VLATISSEQSEQTPPVVVPVVHAVRSTKVFSAVPTISKVFKASPVPLLTEAPSNSGLNLTGVHPGKLSLAVVWLRHDRGLAACQVVVV